MALALVELSIKKIVVVHNVHHTSTSILGMPFISRKLKMVFVSEIK